MARSGAIARLCPITEANRDGIFAARPFLDAGGRFGVGSDSTRADRRCRRAAPARIFAAPRTSRAQCARPSQRLDRAAAVRRSTGGRRGGARRIRRRALPEATPRTLFPSTLTPAGDGRKAIEAMRSSTHRILQAELAELRVGAASRRAGRGRPSSRAARRSRRRSSRRCATRRGRTRGCTPSIYSQHPRRHHRKDRVGQISSPAIACRSEKQAQCGSISSSSRMTVNKAMTQLARSRR